MPGDEFARTERGVPVFDAEEIASAPRPEKKEAREVGEGPAWAGTLANLPAQPVPTPMAAPIASPPQIYESADDVAPTMLHHKAQPNIKAPPRVVARPGTQLSS